MNWYPWVVFVHVAAAFLFVMGHGASMWASDQIRKERDPERIKVLLELLGLSEFGHYYPRALSGGMRQRVALGRLLAYDPEIMLMDEPFGALDAQTKILMGYELLRIWTDYRKSVVFVTHDIEEAIGLSDRILVMTDRPGRIKSEYRVELPRPRDLRAGAKCRRSIN